MQSVICSLHSVVCSLQSAVCSLQSAVCKSAVCSLQSANVRHRDGEAANRIRNGDWMQDQTLKYDLSRKSGKTGKKVRF